MKFVTWLFSSLIFITVIIFKPKFDGVDGGRMQDKAKPM